jgi:molecular chaperone DnaK
MVQEAQKHQSEDVHIRELVEARNLADNAIYQVEKGLRENSNVPSELKSEVEGKITELRQTMNGDDLNGIKRLSSELEQLYAKIMQPATQPNESPDNENGPKSNPDGDVIEGEFRAA